MLSSDPLTAIVEYHERSKHGPGRFAASLGYMDWANQPDPFRRFSGAATISLDRVAPTNEPTYDAIASGVAPRPLDRSTVSQLFYDSLAVSAWKAHQSSRWSLRVNPSSGNLHPTEGYLVVGPVAGLHDEACVYHYAPEVHALEVRRRLAASDWQALGRGLPPSCLLVGLTTIYWRESWKYGERAFRYCQLDLGHAIGALVFAAAALGWRTLVLEGTGEDAVTHLLGISQQGGIEAEQPDCLILVDTRPDDGRDQAALLDWQLPSELVERLAEEPCGEEPNRLSRRHHAWPAIEEAAEASRRRGPGRSTGVALTRPSRGAGLAAQDRGIPARRIIRQRRSAMELDGETAMERTDFYRLLGRLRPGAHPFLALPWPPSIHLALFVHRVEGLEPGLYMLAREGREREALKEAFRPEFAWSQPPGCPAGLGLSLLAEGDFRRAAAQISCGQSIAADGVFSLGMLARFEPALDLHGPGFYRRLYWEAGLVGQVLYLEAEAAGVRATGIGCFLDDVMHELLGLGDRHYQSLYHLAVGGALEDPRLQTQPAYDEG